MRLVPFIITLFMASPLVAQVGGSSSYGFMSLPSSARALALGGNIIHTAEGDVNQGYHNPAALNSEMDGSLSFNNAFYFAGTTYGYFGYGRSLPKLEATGSAGIFFVNYGKFTGTDAAGNLTADFRAADLIAHVGISRHYSPRLRYGANLNLIYSQLESYSALAISADLGSFYEDTARLFTAALVLRNIGTPIKSYTPDNREALPFEIQFGVSKRLEHTPFRLMVVAHNLQTPNIRYEDPNAQPTTNLFNDTTQTTKEKKYIADKIARHLIFGTEFYLGKTLRLRVAYNHQRRAEMAVPTKRALTGFSFGMGMRIYRFNMDYGFGLYHLGGVSHMIGISTRVSEFWGR